MVALGGAAGSGARDHGDAVALAIEVMLDGLGADQGGSSEGLSVDGCRCGMVASEGDGSGSSSSRGATQPPNYLMSEPLIYRLAHQIAQLTKQSTT